MSHELLKNTQAIENRFINMTFDMDRITEAVCPTYYSTWHDTINYGTIAGFTYLSSTTGHVRPANIWLPPDYTAARTYPVLYFLHGIFGNEDSMIKDENNKLDILLGNLIAKDIIRDVIVVFPNMYAASDPDLRPGFDAASIAPYDNFINDLTTDLMPYIEKHYAVSCKPKERGIIGFSMGGRESLFIGLSRSDLFDAIGAIAPAPGLTPTQDWAMNHAGQLTEEQLIFHHKESPANFLMICCGNKDSVVGQFPSCYHQILSRNHVTHLWYEVPQADHDSNAIQSGFYNYLIRWLHN